MLCELEDRCPRGDSSGNSSLEKGGHRPKTVTIPFSRPFGRAPHLEMVTSVGRGLSAAKMQSVTAFRSRFRDGSGLSTRHSRMMMMLFITHLSQRLSPQAATAATLSHQPHRTSNASQPKAINAVSMS